ncbi:Glycine--tRNA ligase (Gly-tRNA) [Candidatus Karelsulcia muelleri]|nr:Glycine--tRNA ligase (Gly-tRNA) [Candidatus Karelsulcia muelleri]
MTVCPVNCIKKYKSIKKEKRKKKNNKISFKEIVSHAKQYGFVFPSSEIYDGINAIYDYGQYGIYLKNNIKEYWWKSMIQINENIIGLDTSILMHPNIWKASGHVYKFKEIFLYNEETKYSYRLDLFIENYFQEKNIRNKEKNLKNNLIKYIYKKFKENDKEKILRLINKIKSKKNLRKWTKIYEYNLMFKIPLKEHEKKNFYLRPETAQGIFTNFLNVLNTSKMKIPFGIAQIGKVFRKEIIARQFLFRMREFEQMEMQFFIFPNQEKKWLEYWKNNRLKWHLSLGLGEKKYRFYEHEQLAHYAKKAYDIQFKFPFGFKELEGIHSRTNFDLKNHEKYSKKRFRVFDKEKNNFSIPYIIETSVGLDRIFLAVFSSSLKKETIKDTKKERIILKINPALSPIKAAIFPLIQDKRLISLAKEIYKKLKLDFILIYEEKDSIGKRYRRQDAIGTPICVTIDFKTLKDKCVTMRFRDKMLQKRVLIKDLKREIKKETSMKKLFQLLR